MTQAAKDNGIGIYADAVMNHLLNGGSTERFKVVKSDKDGNDIGEELDIEGWTRFDYSTRAGEYSDMTWQ